MLKVVRGWCLYQQDSIACSDSMFFLSGITQGTINRGERPAHSYEKASKETQPKVSGDIIKSPESGYTKVSVEHTLSQNNKSSQGQHFRFLMRGPVLHCAFFLPKRFRVRGQAPQPLQLTNYPTSTIVASEHHSTIHCVLRATFYSLYT